MKVTFLFNELTVPSAGYVPRNRVPSRLPSAGTFCLPLLSLSLSFSLSLSLSFLLSIAAREKEYNVADRPENYKFSRCGVSFEPNSSRTSRLRNGSRRFFSHTCQPYNSHVNSPAGYRFRLAEDENIGASWPRALELIIWGICSNLLYVGSCWKLISVSCLSSRERNGSSISIRLLQLTMLRNGSVVKL